MLWEPNCGMSAIHQEIRFKRYEFNEMLMIYLRKCLRDQWYNCFSGTELLLTEVVDLEFEKVCLEKYEALVCFLIGRLETKTTLSADLEILMEHAARKPEGKAPELS